MLDNIKTYEFLQSVGLVTVCASVVTMILTSIVKFILTKSKVLNNNTEPVKKDIILSRIGRVIGLIAYSSFYVLNVLYIEKTKLVIDVKLITSLLSGGTLTLIVSKGIYTMIRQMEKKNSVYEKLEIAEETIEELQREINSINARSHKIKNGIESVKIERDSETIKNKEIGFSDIL